MENEQKAVIGKVVITFNDGSRFKIHNIYPFKNPATAKLFK